MHTIPASEVKRRGVAVLEEHLREGPVHIIKNNRLACVVLSEEHYAALVNRVNSAASVSVWEMLDNRPWDGKRSKKEIDKQIKKERDSWKK